MKLINSILISDVHILKNVSDFLSSLTLIDVIFFFSIILLMILVVVLLYFIKANEDDNVDEEGINSSAELSKIKEENNIEQSSYVDEGELVDLTSITKALENLDNSKIDLTAFEEEQEKDAIISYDELISKSKTGSINYKNETMMDDLSVKEVDLDNLINEANKEEVTTTVKTSVISYAQEEAFLEALKKLQKQLN
jgi:hypothetical protein